MIRDSVACAAVQLSTAIVIVVLNHDDFAAAVADVVVRLKTTD